jgi:hypothetical protein
VLVVPPALGWIGYRIALELETTDVHPLRRKKGVVLRRNAEGGYDET